MAIRNLFQNVVKEDITITRAYLRLPDKEFIKMLNSIEEALISGYNES